MIKVLICRNININNRRILKADKYNIDTLQTVIEHIHYTSIRGTIEEDSDFFTDKLEYILRPEEFYDKTIWKNDGIGFGVLSGGVPNYRLFKLVDEEFMSQYLSEFGDNKHLSTRSNNFVRDLKENYKKYIDEAQIKMIIE